MTENVQAFRHKKTILFVQTIKATAPEETDKKVMIRHERFPSINAAKRANRTTKFPKWVDGSFPRPHDHCEFIKHGREA